MASRRHSANESSVPLTTYDASITAVTTITDSQSVMATFSEWVLCTTYHIWHQHLCCDYNKSFPGHHGDSQRVSPLYHLPHMTPASLQPPIYLIPQPSWRQSAIESSVPLHCRSCRRTGPEPGANSRLPRTAVPLLDTNVIINALISSPT